MHSLGPFKHVGQIAAPQPTHVLLYLLQAQWLHLFMLLLLLLLIIVTTPYQYNI
jgi:hypothetical protein